MARLTFVQANSAAQLTKEVNNLLCFSYSLVGAPFSVDGVPYQMVVQGDDAPKEGREYALLIRYGEMTMPEQLDTYIANGWRLYGNVFTLGHLPVQAVIKGDVPTVGEGTQGGDVVNWGPVIEASKVECNIYTDTQIDTVGNRVDKKFALLDVAVQKGDEQHDALAKRVTDSEGHIDFLAENFSQMRNSTEASLGLLNNSLDMESNERRQDVARLQAQIDALMRMQNVPVDVVAASVPEPAAIPEPAQTLLPDESVWR